MPIEQQIGETSRPKVIFGTGIYEKNIQLVADNVVQLTSPFGDGSCAFYAYSCGLVDGIMTGAIVLTGEAFASLKQYLTENLCSYPIDTLNISHEEKRIIATEVAQFTNLIIDNLTFPQLKKYLCENPSRSKLMALNLAMAPALRAMACDVAEKSYIDMGMSLEDAKMLDADMRNSKTSAGMPQIQALDKALGLTVRAFSEQFANVGGVRTYVVVEGDGASTAVSSPDFTLFVSAKESTQHTTEHWHIVTDAIRTDGIAKCMGITLNGDDNNSIHVFLFLKTLKNQIISEPMYVREKIEYKYQNGMHLGQKLAENLHKVPHAAGAGAAVYYMQILTELTNKQGFDAKKALALVAPTKPARVTSLMTAMVSQLHIEPLGQEFIKYVTFLSQCVGCKKVIDILNRPDWDAKNPYKYLQRNHATSKRLENKFGKAYIKALLSVLHQRDNNADLSDCDLYRLVRAQYPDALPNFSDERPIDMKHSLPAPQDLERAQKEARTLETAAENCSGILAHTTNPKVVSQQQPSALGGFAGTFGQVMSNSQTNSKGAQGRYAQTATSEPRTRSGDAKKTIGYSAFFLPPPPGSKNRPAALYYSGRAEPSPSASSHSESKNSSRPKDYLGWAKHQSASDPSVGPQRNGNSGRPR